MEPNNADGIRLQVELRKKRKEQQEKEKLISRKIIENLDFVGQYKPLKNELLERIPTRRMSLTRKIFNFKALIVDLLRCKMRKSTTEEILNQVEDENEPNGQTILNIVKLLFLIPLNFLSETCCRRRLPSQCFKANLSEKHKRN